MKVDFRDHGAIEKSMRSGVSSQVQNKFRSAGLAGTGGNNNRLGVQNPNQQSILKSQGAYSQNPKENLRDLDDSAQTRKTKGPRAGTVTNKSRSRGGKSKKGGASVVEEETYYDEEEEEEYEDEEEENLPSRKKSNRGKP